MSEVGPNDAPAPGDAAAGATEPTRAFLGRTDFLQAWRDALERIATVGCREVWFCDRDFADWPLGERASVEALTRWAMSHRRLVLLATHFDVVQRQHPRWVTWRRQWSHVVQCRQVDEADVAAIPTMVLAPGVLTLRVHDPLRFRGRLSFDRSDEVRDRDDLDAFLQRSHEAFPATHLGL